MSLGTGCAYNGIDQGLLFGPFHVRTLNGIPFDSVVTRISGWGFLSLQPVMSLIDFFCCLSLLATLGIASRGRP